MNKGKINFEKATKRGNPPASKPVGDECPSADADEGLFGRLEWTVCILLDGHRILCTASKWEYVTRAFCGYSLDEIETGWQIFDLKLNE